MSTATANTDAARRRDRPLLGLRRKPGRLALGVFGLPLPLYHRGWGRLLGHTFLLFTHAGRKSGRPYDAVAMVLRYDPHTREAVICAAWGEDTQWVRNIRARPALRVQIGRKTYVPEQRFLGEDEAVEVVTEFRQRHRGRVRLITTILGWDIRTDTAVREFVRARPFVAFRPAAHDQ